VISFGSACALAFWPDMGLFPRLAMACIVAFPLLVAMRSGFRSTLHGWLYALWSALILFAAICAILSSYLILTVRQVHIIGPL
jgi:hypothetical protein